MEKFQIAKYGILQVVAVMYGILICGAAAKMGRGILEQGIQMSKCYYLAVYFRDYGLLLLFVVMGWTALAAYLSSPISPWNVAPDHVAISGLVLAIFLAVVGTLVGFGGFMSSEIVMIGMRDQ